MAKRMLDLGSNADFDRVVHHAHGIGCNFVAAGSARHDSGFEIEGPAVADAHDRAVNDRSL